MTDEIKVGSIVEIHCECGSNFCVQHPIGFVDSLMGKDRIAVKFPGLTADRHDYRRDQVKIIGEIDHE
jgi:hypothetical protein